MIRRHVEAVLHVLDVCHSFSVILLQNHKLDFDETLHENEYQVSLCTLSATVTYWHNAATSLEFVPGKKVRDGETSVFL